MTAKHRLSVCALGALAGLALCTSARAQAHVVQASFTQAGSPLTPTVSRMADFDAAPRSLGTWVELHVGRLTLAQPPNILGRMSVGTERPEVGYSPLRASLASDLRPPSLPAPAVEPMAAINGVRQLPLSVGTVSALGHFSDRRTLEHALGARGQGRLYRIGVKLDF